MSLAHPSLEVRPAAGAGERESAIALRHAVFCQEQHVPPELELDGRDDAALHFVALEGGELVGTCRLLFDRETAKLGRLAVRRDARRRGTGGGLLDAAEHEARARGARRIALNAQLAATGVYESRGFRPLGKPFEEAGIEHVRMEKRLA